MYNSTYILTLCDGKYQTGSVLSCLTCIVVHCVELLATRPQTIIKTKLNIKEQI